MHYATAQITSHTHGDGVHIMTLHTPDVAKAAKPGQFVMVYLDKGEHLLPRPISIFDADAAKGDVTLAYVQAGAGTKIMSRWEEGRIIRIIGPLGNGFELEFPQPTDSNLHVVGAGSSRPSQPKEDSSGHTCQLSTPNISSGREDPAPTVCNASPGKLRASVAIIGGGIGTAPLHFLAKELARQGTPTSIYLGFKHPSPTLTNYFATLTSHLHIATEDKTGYVTDLLPTSPTYTSILTCGPTPMLKAVAAYAQTHNIPCQVSMEARMACGLGACKGCVIKSPPQHDTAYQLCCINGPVFPSQDVNLGFDDLVQGDPKPGGEQK